MRHSITLTTAAPTETAKAKSRTSSMTIFLISDAARDHHGSPLEAVNEIATLTSTNNINPATT
jgi:hypothetical protein